jgi:hypothetical protein
MSPATAEGPNLKDAAGTRRATRQSVVAGTIGVLLIVLVVGSLWLRAAGSANPTVTGSPTRRAAINHPSKPTAGPTPRPTRTRLEANALITHALIQSNNAYVRSLACVCDSGLEATKTGADLQKYLTRLRTLKKSGEHWDITVHTFHVDWIRLQSPTSAYAQVSKDETQNKYRGIRVLQVCDGPYQVRYHAVKQHGAWKVDDTTAVHANQRCQRF